MGFKCLKATEILQGRQFTFSHCVPRIPQNDRLVPSFLAKMKILLILAKYSGKIQKQPPVEVFYEKGLQLY